MNDCAALQRAVVKLQIAIPLQRPQGRRKDSCPQGQWWLALSCGGPDDRENCVSERRVHGVDGYDSERRSKRDSSLGMTKSAARMTLLEPDIRTECRAKVVVRAVVKIHFIADVQAQANRAYVAFQAATGIKSPHHVVITEVLHAADEGA